MKLRLSYFGWMVARHLIKHGQLRMGINPRNDLLLDLWTGTIADFIQNNVTHQLLADGLVEIVDEGISQEQTLLRYQRNPFENLTKIIFEYTTLCNYDCAHCYNTRVPHQTETRPELLSQAAEIFLQMGIRRFDFVGGEVSRYGDGWLDLTRNIRARGDDIIISLFTNGWWLEQNNFQAADRQYADSWEYLADLKASGVSHVAFSLDGPAALHDLSRKQPGLHQRIMDGLRQVRQAGLEARVSLLIRPEWSSELVEEFLAEPASIMYDLPSRMSANERALHLSLDPSNAISNFIDIGNGAGDETFQIPFLDGNHSNLYCRQFFRLSPSLTIKANGELATCRLSSVGEGYGNLQDRRLVDILNHFDDAFIYQLHAERRLDEYLPLVDRALFGEAFSHLCTLRSIVTLLARKMHEQGVDFTDSKGIERINRQVAFLTGHIPREKIS
jgi:sulfatase maturation enzyme AslB (radical SAM superfamily)